MKVYDLVKRILTGTPRTRESDNELILEVLIRLNNATVHNSGLSGRQVVIKDWNVMPSFESITRARRKIQELYPELRGKNYKKGKRLEKELTKGTFIYREEIK